MTAQGELMVAAYCRVSTDRADQANSLRSQQDYFRSYIETRPGWRLFQVYADEGLSGTSTRRRAAFGQMMEDAAAGRFGLILTKEVSRFARNTVDTLEYTRRLREMGVGVVFLSDGIDTRDNDGELRLTIMASMAQEESRKTSQRVKWGQRRRMEAGVVFGNDSTYGFETRGGTLIVRPEEAEVVRLIYHKYLAEGKGAHVIARELDQAGIPPPKAERWRENTILRMLRNEKYAGDLRQKKYVTVDYLTHRKVENRGQEEQIYLRDHHQPIVDRETWTAVQEELARRNETRRAGGRHSGRRWTSGKVRCGVCGEPCISRTAIRKGGMVYRSWGCRAGCGVGTVNDRALFACGRFALEQMGVDLDGELTELAGELERMRRSARTGSGGEERRREARRRLRRALEGYLDGVLTAGELEEIRQRCNRAMAQAEEKKDSSSPAISAATPELWEAVLDHTIQRITVFPGCLEISFQTGLGDIKVWYTTTGKGERYQTLFQRWEQNSVGEK